MKHHLRYLKAVEAFLTNIVHYTKTMKKLFLHAEVWVSFSFQARLEGLSKRIRLAITAKSKGLK